MYSFKEEMFLRGIPTFYIKKLCSCLDGDFSNTDDKRKYYDLFDLLIYSIYFQCLYETLQDLPSWPESKV